MRFKARATTDTQGMRPIHRGLFLSDLKRQTLERKRDLVWDVDIALKKISLAELLNHKSYSLLANHLVNINKYPANISVLAGRTTGFVEIKVGKTRYRAKGWEIHKK